MQAAGAAVTMVGVAAIAAQGDPARLMALAFNSGDAMMLVAAVFYAGYTVALSAGFEPSARWMAEYRAREIARPMANGEIIALRGGALEGDLS